MIVKTTIEINNTTYDHTYSDAKMMIERDGAYFSDAIDPIGANRVYTETNIPIEYEEELFAKEALDIIFGGTL